MLRLLRAIRHPFMGLRIWMKRRLVQSLARTGEGFRAGAHVMISNPSGDRDRIVIGEEVSLLGALHVQGPGRISIGDYTTIRYGSVLQAVERIEIGSHVMVSHDVFIQDSNTHPLSPRERHELCHSLFAPALNSWERAEHAPIVIEDDVWIGMQALILKGVRIGRGAIVGAAAVVTKDVPPFSVVAGNPARVVKELENDLDGEAGG